MRQTTVKVAVSYFFKNHKKIKVMTTEEVKEVITSADQVNESYRCAIVAKVNANGDLSLSAYGEPDALYRVLWSISKGMQ